jgi:hypothetical protein
MKKKSKKLYVFIHIHKTAGSTMRWVLWSSFGMRHANVDPWNLNEDYNPIWLRPFTANDFKLTRNISPIPLKSIAGHSLKAYIDLGLSDQEVRYFTFLRDPVKLHASLYQYHVSPERLSFNISVSDYMKMGFRHNRQCMMLCGEQNADLAIETIKKKKFLLV